MDDTPKEPRGLAKVRSRNQVTPERAQLRDELLDLARRADQNGDGEQASVLTQARWELLDAEGQDVVHQNRMDLVRVSLAGLLIFILFAITLIGVVANKSGEEIAQLAAPASGLAGIAIGWLFSSRP